MRPGISRGGPVAADKQKGTWLPIEGFFGIVTVISIWSQSEPFFNGIAVPESNASLCCELGEICGQAAVVKGFPLDFSSDSSSMFILEGSFSISLDFNECSEFTGADVLLIVNSGENRLSSSIT